MVDRDPIKTDRRRRRRQQRLGCEHPICVICGHPGLEALKDVTVARLKELGIEMHHPVGKNNDPELVVPLCLNCHRMATEGLALAAVSMLTENDPRALIAKVLDALAVFFEMLAVALRRWAELLRSNPDVAEARNV